MSAKEIVAFLGENPVFAGIPARWFYVVRSGHVKIVRHSRTGKDVVSALAKGATY